MASAIQRLVRPPSDPAGCARDAIEAAVRLRALANPWRLEIVRLLATEDLDGTTRANRLGLSVANASQHPSRLRAAGIVGSRQDGTRRVCSLVDQRAREVFRILSLPRI